MKFCVKCGEKLEVGVNFCTTCGYKQPDLGEIKPKVSLLQSPKQGEPIQKKKKRTKEDITDVIGCILIISGFVVLIILYAFFEEWLAILWPYIVAIIVISWIVRLVGAGIIEIFKRSKK